MAEPKDAAQILAIYAPYILNTSTSFELEVPTIPSFATRIQNYVQEAPWLVCETNQQIIGYAYASPHRGRAAYQWNREVSVYISEEYQRLGLAQQLYTTLFELLRLQGYRNVLAGIVSPNPASEQFHERLGFTKIGTYRNVGYKFNTWHSVGWYEYFFPFSDKTPKTIISTQEMMQSKDYQAIIKEANRLI